MIPKKRLKELLKQGATIYTEDETYTLINDEYQYFDLVDKFLYIDTEDKMRPFTFDELYENEEDAILAKINTLQQQIDELKGELK